MQVLSTQSQGPVSEAGSGIRAGAKMALRLSPPGATLGARELDQFIRKTGGRVSRTHSPKWRRSRWDRNTTRLPTDLPEVMRVGRRSQGSVGSEGLCTGKVLVCPGSVCAGWVPGMPCAGQR